MAKKQPEKELKEKSTSEKVAIEPKPVVKAKKVKTKKSMPAFLRIPLTPFLAFGRYVKGSWDELRQVKWPTRKATWALTLAVILFTLFFALVITSLDAGFKKLFEEVIL